MNGVRVPVTGTVLRVLCLTVWFKFPEGGWVTLLITGLFVAGSLAIRRHYRDAQESMRRLDDLLLALPPVTVPGGAGADDPAAGPHGGHHGLRVQRPRDARFLLRRQAVPRNVPKLRLHLRGGRRHERVQGGGGGGEPGARPPGAGREVRGVREGARLLRGGPNHGGDGFHRVHHPPCRGGGEGLPERRRLCRQTRLQGGEPALPPPPQPDRLHGAETAGVRGPADDRDADPRLSNEARRG